MRAVVQRVSQANVSVQGKIVGSIDRGLLVLVGVANSDQPSDASYLADKLVGLRIFDDADGKMNLSAENVNGSMLVISQFTLLGDCRKGRRPSFIDAAEPTVAESLYEQLVGQLRLHIPVETGRFQATMQVQLINDGPVTVLIDSRKEF
jgi:D-tyrosyl-tRNA(Tyr) deacylase